MLDWGRIVRYPKRWEQTKLKKKSTRKLVSVTLGLMLLSNGVALNPSYAISGEPRIPSSVELPAAPVWGHFVDAYKNNTSVNKEVYSNPSIGVLSGFLELWAPGDSWDNGTKLNSSVLDANIQYVVNTAATRSAADEERAYYDDRRNQTYGAADGLGSLSQVYREKSGTYTTINSIPENATSVKYNDGNGSNQAGDSSSELGKMVDLIGKLRGNYASTTPAKNYYSYPRPYRWANDTSIIVPTLVPAISQTPATDGGFPSGHTNASYLAALSLAYAVPERYQELLTRASEMGNSRVVAGMHSPLDVMGGRVMATALAAATLNDPDNAELKKAAYDQAHEFLLTETGTAEDRFSNYDQNKAQFTQRLTYDFPQIASTTKPVSVPKGAEVLLETRLPYLSDAQRREVLATTGLPSGYPVLDDPEGWGRLNLFAAADGYGAFHNDVTVTMDAYQGGFHAEDRWRNNISGVGKLTKEGAGTLKLQGSNTYSGGTQINAGTLEGDSATAFGSGDVFNNGGTVVENVYGAMTIGGNFTQTAGSTLELNLIRSDDVVDIQGTVQLAGALHVKFADGYVPGRGSITLITHGANERTGSFDAVTITGVPNQYNAKIVYQADKVVLSITSKSSSDSSSGGSGSTGGTSGGTNNGGTTTGGTTTGGTTSGGTTPATPTDNGASEQPSGVNPFQSNVISQQAVLQAITDAIAAASNRTTSFKDTASHWGSDTIGTAFKLGIVDGYSDGTFRPDATVTRAEFVAMIARAFGLTAGSASTDFKDTSAHWAAGYIATLAEKDIVNGYTDGSFKPNATISRAEMVAIISRVLNLEVLATGTPASFTDVSSNYWAAQAIQQASSANLVQGMSASTFVPQNHATRAEALTIIIRALKSDSSIRALIEGL